MASYGNKWSEEIKVIYLINCNLDTIVVSRHISGVLLLENYEHGGNTSWSLLLARNLSNPVILFASNRFVKIIIHKIQQKDQMPDAG